MKSTLIIGGASDEHDRHEMDYYPTPPECTHALMKFLALPKSSEVWECACGEGAISVILAKYVSSVISTDIRIDSGFGIGGIDFLESEKLANVIITNPPFNKSEDFIKRCHVLDAYMFCMLLKSQYWHSKSRLKIFKEIKPAFILPLTWRPNFAPNRGKSPTMDMIWTVWIKGVFESKYIPLEKDPPSAHRPTLFDSC